MVSIHMYIFNLTVEDNSEKIRASGLNLKESNSKYQNHEKYQLNVQVYIKHGISELQRVPSTSKLYSEHSDCSKLFLFFHRVCLRIVSADIHEYKYSSHSTIKWRIKNPIISLQDRYLQRQNKHLTNNFTKLLKMLFLVFALTSFSYSIEIVRSW